MGFWGSPKPSAGWQWVESAELPTIERFAALQEGIEIVRLGPGSGVVHRHQRAMLAAGVATLFDDGFAGA